MARSFLVPINLNQLELQNARVQNLSTTQINAIGSPVSGQVAYDNVLNTLKVYNGTGWTPVGSVSTGSGAPGSAPTSTGSLYLDLTNLVLYVAKATASSADWVPALPYGLTADMANLSTANAQGTSLKVSRADHVHRHTNADHGSITLNALATSAGDYAMGGYKITGLGTPTASTDAANKNYVDAAVTGLNVHDSVRVATTVNLAWTYAAGTTDASQGTGIGATLTNPSTGTTVIDTYTLLVNDRVLVKNQTTQTQNGLYVVTTAGTTGVATVLTRATDADNHIAGQISGGDFVFATYGGQASTGWTQVGVGTSTTPPNAIRIGTDNIVYSQFSGAGTYTASNGVLLTGSNFTFAPSTTGGLTTGIGGGSLLLDTNSALTTSSTGTKVVPGLGITTSGGGAAGAATANTVAINTDVVTRKYTTTIGDGTSTSITVTHNLNTRYVQVTVFDAASYAQVITDVANTTANTVTVSFANAPASNAYNVVVLG